MTHQAIQTHIEDSLGRLLDQFKGADNVNGVLTVLAQRAQSIEEAINTVESGRRLANAVGQQLDGIGEIVGQPRNGQDDPLYRIFIMGAIAKNNSNGALGSVTEIAQALFQAAAIFVQTPNSPGYDRFSALAQVSLGIGSPVTDLAYMPAIQSIIQAAMPAAVALSDIVLFDASGAFSMAGPQAWVRGFGSLDDPSVGGAFASLLFKNPSQ